MAQGSDGSWTTLTLADRLERESLATSTWQEKRKANTLLPSKSSSNPSCKKHRYAYWIREFFNIPHWLLGGAPTSPRDRDPIPSTSPKHSPSLWLLLWRKQVGRSLIIWCLLVRLHFLIQGVSHLGVCSQGRALQEPAKPRARQVTLKIELNANYKFLCLGLPSPRQLSISARWQTHSPIVTARKSFTGIEMFSFRAKWNKA